MKTSTKKSKSTALGLSWSNENKNAAAKEEVRRNSATSRNSQPHNMAPRNS